MRRRGFSLIEMLVVLAIVGALTGIAVSAFGLSPRLVLDQTARGVLADLRQARLHALHTAAPVTVQLAPLDRAIGIVATNVARTLPKTLSITAKGAAAAQVIGDEVTLVFYPDGTSSGLTLTLGAGRVQREITVDWLTGRIEVQGAAG